ncbi:unnamed protein product [Sphagnum jensenii]|uniref:Uncharacterized protein n=1 Tax=Sphagnum jensenii TaxID=128206 RepID=A0ABP1ABD1_9BRYO
MEADQKNNDDDNNHQVNLVSQEILLETDQKETAAGGTLSSSREQQSETQQHNLLTALESKIEQLHSVMQNEELEGTIHQVVDKLRQESEAESEAEKSHTDLHTAVDELKAKLVEKSKQVKSYELALKATTQQLEELALISETRLKNAAEHQAGSRSSASAAPAAAADEETTTTKKCQGCQLRKAELSELEDARRQLEITNEILVQRLNARDKLMADLEGAIKQFEDQLLLSPQQQQQEALGGALNTLLPEEEVVKCKTCGLSQLELNVLSDARRQLKETNDVLLQRLNGRNQRISELEGTVKQFECELQEAQACLQETSLLIAARDKRIQRLEMELLCSAAAAAASVTPHDVQQPPCTRAAASQEQSKRGAVNQGANPKQKAGSNPPPSSCAAGQGQQDQQKTPNNSSSVCPGGAMMRKAMQSSSSSSSSPPMMRDTMRHAYEHAKEALQHSVDTSIEGGGGGGGSSHCPIQGAFARMGVCTTKSAQQQEDSTALKSSSPSSSHVVQGASRNQELYCQPMIPSHAEFYTHADPATTYRLNRNADHHSSSMISDRLQDVSVPYSTVVELSRQQQQTTAAGISWISDFPQPFHSSSMHATVASRSTSPGGDSSPSQELPPLADVAGSIYHHYPHHTPSKLQY